MALHGHKLNTVRPIQGKLFAIFACGKSQPLTQYQLNYRSGLSRTWNMVTCLDCLATKKKKVKE